MLYFSIVCYATLKFVCDIGSICVLLNATPTLAPASHTHTSPCSSFRSKYCLLTFKVAPFAFLHSIKIKINCRNRFLLSSSQMRKQSWSIFLLVHFIMYTMCLQCLQLIYTHFRYVDYTITVFLHKNMLKSSLLS